jgi:hypothetical protein
MIPILCGIPTSPSWTPNNLPEGHLIRTGAGIRDAKEKEDAGAAHAAPAPDARSTASSLEVQLQCELDFTRIARPARISTQDRRDRVGNFAKTTQTASGIVRIWTCEVGMIEGIEKFSSEL